MSKDEHTYMCSCMNAENMPSLLSQIGLMNVNVHGYHVEHIKIKNHGFIVHKGLVDNTCTKTLLLSLRRLVVVGPCHHWALRCSPLIVFFASSFCHHLDLYRCELSIIYLQPFSPIHYGFNKIFAST